jgi:hypothetical protein
MHAYIPLFVSFDWAGNFISYVLFLLVDNQMLSNNFHKKCFSLLEYNFKRVTSTIEKNVFITIFNGTLMYKRQGVPGYYLKVQGVSHFISN